MACMMYSMTSIYLKMMRSIRKNIGIMIRARSSSASLRDVRVVLASVAGVVAGATRRVHRYCNTITKTWKSNNMTGMRKLMHARLRDGRVWRSCSLCAMSALRNHATVRVERELLMPHGGDGPVDLTSRAGNLESRFFGLVSVQGME
ncbi:MAG: hypothetical protein JW384_02413 [Nitrosomonadaceae bacterium]|nr:hypothetical protein [Nitrosomonadaceae bacterium]